MVVNPSKRLSSMALGAVGMCLCFGVVLSAAAQASSNAPQVRVAEARGVQAQSPLRLPARTAPAETALIFSRASGIVGERLVDIGDSVRRGDVLVRIHAPEVERAYDGAVASVRQAQAREQLAAANLKRGESLVDQGYVSAAQLDELRAAVTVAAADKAVAEAEAQRLREIVRFQTVTAPMDGVVVERQVERGDRVNGDASGAAGYLFRLARLDELRVEIDVPQAESLNFKAGDSAVLRFSELPGQALEAVVARRSGAISADTGTMRIELSLPNPDLRLPAGLRGEVSLTPATSALVSIPANALMMQGGAPTVAVLEQDRIRFRTVGVARSTDREVLIQQGLSVGEKVVQSPNALLRDGDVVALLSAATQP